ncbi:hypothetical protein CEP50_02570 [Actinopolyspora mortivallis]|uniref:Alpha/beta hydrolase n=1 Tax=Actinopolyspora mortivallis TaxID=33906 RepID=A0A2T0H045_ACTMO|nr:hypothetical protein CEP50_02570 [Actinopolyspora mortivallis]
MEPELTSDAVATGTEEDGGYSLPEAGHLLSEDLPEAVVAAVLDVLNHSSAITTATDGALPVE